MFLLLMACTGAGKDGSPADTVPAETAAPGLPTPEEVVATAVEGDLVHFSGTVHTLTFDSEGTGTGSDGDDTWLRTDARWLLVRSEVPDGVAWADVSLTDLEDEEQIGLGWGLGVALDPAQDAPRIDETVEVSGTFHVGSWNGYALPVVEDAEILARSGTALGAVGATCALDADCIDTLVCDRATTLCAAPTEIGWASLWRDVDGHCYSDADCPLGQTCDTRYVVPDSGDYTWRFAGASKTGASLCVPSDLANPAASCGRIDHPQDLAGGRFTEGKEVCIQGTVQLVVGAADGDSHLQLKVDEPLPYPRMDAPVRVFGATTEIGPPVKSPDRPEGALLDPDDGDEIVVMGTMRFDGGHGWYELHPAKVWWPASDSGTLEREAR